MIVGEWAVDPVSGQISRDGEIVRVDARLMRLLMCLAARAGEVVTTEELLAEVWSGVVVTQDSVYQAVASLRRALGDDSKKPAYVATVPRRGYRLVARVERGSGVGVAAAAPAPTAGGVSAAAAVSASAAMGAPSGAAVIASAAAGAASPVPAPVGRWKLGTLLATGAVLCLAQAASVDPGAAPPQRSVAVLPFLDLTTESMDQEFFADGLTEELIDDLSRVPGLKVPSPTASFFFKGKQMPVANIARELGVAYVVDGSLRKADSTLRVAARLVRADNGYVIWSGTYDRQSDNVLKIQGDVAADVTQALRATLQSLPTGTGSVR
jgi:TolB-like protein